MALTILKIRTAKPAGKPRKLYDEHGLFILLTPRGARLWRFRYHFDRKEKLLALGSYPEVGLKDARAKRDDARRLLAEGIDPGEARKAAKAKQRSKTGDSFEAVAREWFDKFSSGWKPSHSSKIIRRLERDVFPWVGSRPIGEITETELLQVLTRIADRGAVDTAHRAKQNCSQIFCYGAATGRGNSDPTALLKRALPPATGSHFAAITAPEAIGPLLRALDGYPGTLVVRCALRLAPLVFVRPGELRGAQWQEFNLVRSEWRIPGERMKRGQPHIVPLSRQAVAILKELEPLTGNGHLVFPSERSRTKAISDNTLNAALRRLDYSKDQMTAHGFRTMASTLLNENGWPPDVIERQLAHTERNSVRAAYNHADYLEKRREMMQWWADYLDELRDGSVGFSRHKWS